MELNRRKSLDEIEKQNWNPAPSLLELPQSEAQLLDTMPSLPFTPLPELSLNGQWEMAPDGYTHKRLGGNWDDALPANVPGTIHTALLENGEIPDPMVGRNDKMARENSYRVWWLKRTFSSEQAPADPWLVFDGVCYRARFWLNGTYLGEHGGMFGGPEYPVGHLLKDSNTLIVRIENAPADPKAYSEYADYDEGWKNGVVINCVYGWHYACIPARGIWAPVRLVSRLAVRLDRPFVSVRDPHKGVVDVCFRILCDTTSAMLKGKVTGVIRPDNFEGEGSGFSLDIGMNQKKNDYRIELCIPNPQIWWPNGHGAQPLYTLDLTFEPENGAGQSRRETFGIRTIEMAPLPDGPNEDIHNWTFVVNGKPVFVKGANWCTTDALLRCGRERYTRFLTLAKQQHIQLLRAWGGGIPETDLFYDLCDRLGLMVIQEWPTCWDSHKIQPREELYETIRYNVPRLRNHPSLIQWAGGNESAEADGEVMDEMARLTYELDGSRCFHRTSPWGGSIHNYGTYWGLQDIDETLKLKAPFIGEFGMASAPNLQSVRRYLPREEWEVWDTGAVNCFNYHTPRFNQKMWSELDMVHLLKRVPEFYDADTMEHFIIATQLAQATCIRHLLESFRSRWPESTGICYYKLTDVYPACSWSTVDYYGVPKLSYYMIADSYEPLHACITVESMTAGAGWSAPVFLLNDAETPPGDDCKVIVSAYDGGLQQICRQVYEVRESAKVLKLGSFKPEGIEPEKGPLFVTAEVRIDGRTHHRTFYWFNYKDKPGCLFSRPRTSLAWEVQGNELTVANTGNLPAVGVTVECLPHDTEFTVSDSVFWLEAGEKRVLQVSHDDGLSVTAWNI